MVEYIWTDKELRNARDAALEAVLEILKGHEQEPEELDEGFSVDDYAGGNINNAYYLGHRHGWDNGRYNLVKTLEAAIIDFRDTLKGD